MSLVCESCGYKFEQDHLFERQEEKKLDDGKILTCPNCPSPPPAEAIPKRMTISENGEELIITLEVFTVPTILIFSFLTFFSILLALPFTPQLLQAIQDPSTLDHQVGLGIAVVVILLITIFIYSILITCNNRISFIINRELGTFNLKHGPLPTLGNLSLNLRIRPKMVIKRVSSYKHPDIYYFYFIDFKDKVYLAFFLADNHEYTHFIRNELTRFLAEEG